MVKWRGIFETRRTDVFRLGCTGFGRVPKLARTSRRQRSSCCTKAPGVPGGAHTSGHWSFPRCAIPEGRMRDVAANNPPEGLDYGLCLGVRLPGSTREGNVPLQRMEGRHVLPCRELGGSPLSPSVRILWRENTERVGLADPFMLPFIHYQTQCRETAVNPWLEPRITAVPNQGVISRQGVW